MINKNILCYLTLTFRVSPLQGGLHGFCGAWQRCNSLEWNEPFRVVAPCPPPQKPLTPLRPTAGFRLTGMPMQHAGQHVILVDQMMLESGAGMNDDHGSEQEVEGLMHLQ